jgi:two-component system phosphate regulon sensor histidine kinase PhoR
VVTGKFVLITNLQLPITSHQFGVVLLKSVRNLYLIVTAVVAISLLAGGLAQWLGSGTEEGGRFAAYVQLGYVVSACHILAAVGVIWLGWYWIKMAGAVTSMAKRLEADKLRGVNLKDPQRPEFKPYDGVRVKQVHNAVIDELSEVVNERICDCSNIIGGLEKQINDLQIQIRLTQRQKGHIEAIIYSIHDAVIVIDEFDRLLMANEAAGKLFHFDFKSDQHERIDRLIGEGKLEFIEFLRHSRQSKAQPIRKEIEFPEHVEPKTYDCIVSCIYDENKQVCGVVAVLHDITREKQIQQAKNDFVNHVCHELKTPLASISAYSEMLIDGEADDEKTREEFYSVIQTQAERLNRLIEDILNISRIESGLIKVKKEPVSLTMIIEEQLLMMKSYAEEKNICLEDIGQRRIVFDRVYADKDMISQVVVNLLSNAVKYTPSGGSVNIEMEVDETDNVARLAVNDTGVGIPEDEIEHVFDKFYRVSTGKKQAKGTGLGLNLVKQIIEKVHDGRVFVSSKTGLGSTFGFELPLVTTEVGESLSAAGEV